MLDWLKNVRVLRLEIFSETTYVARVYADSLRDNFVGYVPNDQERFDVLKTEFDQQISSNTPYLAKLLEIESSLVQLLPDDYIVARFWATNDRFRRVVPAETCAHYDKSVAGYDKSDWTTPTFLRNQTRTLLDVIHSNYLVNTAREKSVKRLKLFIVGFTILIVATGIFIGNYHKSGLITGILMLAGAGIFGAMLSILNRMQTATTGDAMVQDGIYELTGLRVGWVGVLMSYVLGGGFAIVLYGIVMAGALDNVTPKLSLSSPTNVGVSKAIPSENLPVKPTETSLSPTIPTAGAIKCAEPAGGCIAGIMIISRALGFDTATSFYKMLILAFLAGFAERFVPDILNRLSKQPVTK